MKFHRLLTAWAVGAVIASGPVAAEPLTLLDGPTQLRFIDSTAPSVLLQTLAVTGMQPGESIAAIDYRPANGALYAIGFLGSAARLYTVNTATGVATLVGAGPFDPSLGAGVYIGMDFNPVTDRIRATSNIGTNLRIDPTTGTVVATDTSTAFAAGDINAGVNNAPLGLAYSNNVAGAAATTLYGIVFGSNGSVLATVGSVGGSPTSPNSGQMFTVGPTAVSGYSGARQGFDISSSGAVYAVVDNDSVLYSINLATGAATSLGSLPAGTAIRDVTAGGIAAPAAISNVPALDPVTLLALVILLGVAGALAMRRA